MKKQRRIIRKDNISVHDSWWSRVLFLWLVLVRKNCGGRKSCMVSLTGHLLGHNLRWIFHQFTHEVLVRAQYSLNLSPIHSRGARSLTILFGSFTNSSTSCLFMNNTSWIFHQFINELLVRAQYLLNLSPIHLRGARSCTILAESSTNSLTSCPFVHNTCCIFHQYTHEVPVRAQY